MTPPFRPDVDGATCVANFDEEFTSLDVSRVDDNSPCGSPTPEQSTEARDHFSGCVRPRRRMPEC